MVAGQPGASVRGLFAAAEAAAPEAAAPSTTSFAAGGGEGPVQLRCLGRFELKVPRALSRRPHAISSCHLEVAGPC